MFKFIAISQQPHFNIQHDCFYRRAFVWHWNYELVHNMFVELVESFVYFLD